MADYNNENPYSNEINQIENKNNRNKLLKEFGEYIQKDNGLDFNIISGEIKIDNIGGFSDGNYKLKNYSIKKIDEYNNIYSLEMDFKIKKGVLSYNEKIELSFYYNNGNELIIKYKNNFHKIKIHNKVSYIESKINRHTTQTDIIGKKLAIEIDNLKLQLEFKTD